MLLKNHARIVDSCPTKLKILPPQSRRNAMTTYLVRLMGQNFLMDGDEGPRKKRFHSTRLVEAENSKQAEILARDLIRNDTNLQNSVLNEVTDLPIINLESVSEVSAMAYDAQNRAHSIYWEDENN